MSHYKPYPAYKDSGVEWLGKVPKEWTIVSLSRLLATPVTDGPHETPEFLSEGIPFLSVDGIQEGELVFDGKRFISEQDHFRFSKKAKPRRDDILLGKAASVGKIARVKTDFEFNIWSPLALIRVNKSQASPTFVEYSLKSTWLQAQTETKANLNTQFNLGMKDISKLLFCVPPADEQLAITSHLDRETTRIDALITKKTRFIELLREKRQALITHAVTKGLDPNVKMKDSGVEWLGEVPEHWEVKPLKYLATHIGSGKTPAGGAEAYQDFGVIFLRSQNVHEEGLRLEDVAFISPEIDEEMKNSRVLRNDVLLNITGGSIGRSCYVSDDIGPANVNQHVCIIRTLHHVLGAWTSRLMASHVAQSQIDFFQNGAGREGLNFEQIGNMVFTFPPPNEIQKILDELSQRTSRADLLISKTERSIELLKERRSALITAAVTGQIDLRDSGITK